MKYWMAISFSLLVLAGIAAAETTMKHTFRIGDESFLLDGQPFQIRSGEMHAARIPLGLLTITNMLKGFTVDGFILGQGLYAHDNAGTLRLQNLWDGIETLAAVMANLGKAWPGAVP